MDPAKFQTQMPGRLEAISANVEVTINGRPTLQPVKAHAFVPAPLPPPLAGDDLARALSAAIDAQSELARLDELLGSLPNFDLLHSQMQKREASYSSKIENTTASVREIDAAHAGVPITRNDVTEVQNNYRAIRFATTSPLPLSLRLMRETHRLLLVGAPTSKRPGEFRKGQVHIGDTLATARFVPPPAGPVLAACLDTFERYINRADSSTPRLPIDLALIHYQFETIHPFADGNGRMGRLLIPLVGMKRNQLRFAVPNVSRYLSRNRREYCDLMLDVSTNGAWVPWIEFFCRAIVEDCRDDAARLRQLAALRDKYRELATGKRTSSLLLSVIDMLFSSPAVSISILTKKLSISAPAAQKHVDHLAKKKILREITGNNYGRVWVAEAIYDIIEAT